MLKRKKIISKLIATTMITTSIASMFVVNASALSVSSSTLAGANRYETAVKISESGWSTATNAVLINGDKGLVDALTATPYAYSKNAPILITSKDKLTAETKARLTRMNVKNVDIVGGTAVVSTAVENELKGMGITVKRIAGKDRFETSVKVAEAIDAISDVSKVAVVNGWTGLPDAVSIAAPAADNNMPILLSDPKTGVSQAKAFIDRENISRSYVIGQTGAVSSSIMNSLPGTKTRLGGTDRHDTNAKVIREFYSSRSLDNVYVAKSGYVKNNEELVDALAVGVLAAKNNDPVLIVGKSLGDTQKSLLADKEFTRMTQVGNGIPSQSINDIKNTQAEEESRVTGVSATNSKTIKITGSHLDKLSASSINISGNSVSSYTSSSNGDTATVVFSNAFTSGKSTTVSVTSNIGNVTNHTFTYTSTNADLSNINSAEVTTKVVGHNGIQYLDLTVNGGKSVTVSELKNAGWTVKFKANADVFYYDGSIAKSTSETGKLATSGLNIGDIFTYYVTLTKGSTTITSSKGYVEVVNKSDLYKSITSLKLNNEDVTLNGTKLVSGENATIVDVKAVDKNNNTVEIDDEDMKGSSSSFRVSSSSPSVVSVINSGSKKNTLTANSPGTATITITNGTITKTFTVTVTADERKASSMALSKSTVYVSNSADATVVATVKDQYGDPVRGFNAGDKLGIASVDLKDKTNTIATVTTSGSTDEEGKINIGVDAHSTNTGSASLAIKNGTSTWATLRVYVKNVADNATSWKLELADSINDDNTIDIYREVGDDTVELEVNGYNSSYFVGKETDLDTPKSYSTDKDSTTFEVLSSNTDIAEVSVNSNNNIVVKANKKAGTATIRLYYKGSSKHTLNITVKDTAPKITNMEINTINTINENKNDYNVIKELFDMTKVGSSYEVEGLTVSGTNGTVIYDENGSEPRFMIKGSDGVERDLAKIVVSTDFGVEANSKGELEIPTNRKGNIIIKIYNTSGGKTTLFETLTVKVDTY